MALLEVIDLYTNRGGFVQRCLIPTFTPPADVILWGERTFQRVISADAVLQHRQQHAYPDRLAPPYRFVECFMYAVIPGNEMLDSDLPIEGVVP